LVVVLLEVMQVMFDDLELRIAVFVAGDLGLNQ